MRATHSTPIAGKAALLQFGPKPLSRVRGIALMLAYGIPTGCVLYVAFVIGVSRLTNLH